VNTIAATTQRIPRPALIGIAVLVAAFVALMVARSGLIGGSSSTAASSEKPTPVHVKPHVTQASPRVVLLPDLPPQIAHALRRSKVVVVSVYFGQAPGDHPAVAEARAGAHQSGAGFVAVNVGGDAAAASVATFVGPETPPTMLVVRRPGKIVTQIPGQVESAIVAQAARNAGARR
jgi:hypothetical protein